MKCPVKVRESSSGSYYISDFNCCYVCGDMRKETADYIVHAINSHEKLVEAIGEIEAVSCGEKQIESDGVYDDSDGMQWIYKRIQALKEAEKPK
jgi:hypothetical protein